MTLIRSALIGYWVIRYKNKIWKTPTTDFADAVLWVMEQEEAGTVPESYQ